MSSIGSAAVGGKNHEVALRGSVPTEAKDPLAQRDRGYVLAQNLQSLIHCLATLLTFEHGSSDHHGVDWDGLSGRADRQKDIKYIIDLFIHVPRPFVMENSAVTRQVRSAALPAEQVRILVTFNKK
jgi:hypothetical protein